VPILLFLYPDKDPEVITAISLLVVLANSVSGSIAYGYQRRIDYRSGLPFAAATLPGAILGAVLVSYIPRQAFDAMFAIVLAGIGLFLLFRGPSNAIHPPAQGRTTVRRNFTDRAGNRYFYSFQMWKALAVSAVIGFVSSLLGIGGGVMHVPMMATMLHFPIHIASATSQFVLAFMAAEGTSVHIARGVITFDRSLAQAAFLAIGAVGGAQAGALLSRRVHGPVIMRALAVGLILVAIRLGMKAVTG